MRQARGVANKSHLNENRSSPKESEIDAKENTNSDTKSFLNMIHVVTQRRRGRREETSRGQRKEWSPKLLVV
jgi:hypothetical protein